MSKNNETINVMQDLNIHPHGHQCARASACVHINAQPSRLVYTRDAADVPCDCFSVSDVDEGEENDRERESWRKKERVVKKVREKREFVL